MGNNRIFNEILEYGHIPLFGTISLLFLNILKKLKPGWRQIHSHITAGVLTILLGIVAEIIQTMLPGRAFELKDILSNTIGALSFLAFAYPFVENINMIKAGIRLMSLILIIAFMYPIYVAAIDTLHMQQEFPLLASFETERELRRWEDGDAQISKSLEHATHENCSLEVHFYPGRHQRFSSKYFMNNWSSYHVLMFDIFLTGESTIPLTVRIDDKDHNQSFDDRYNGKFILNPGMNHIAIDLEDIRNAPATRSMDMKNIALICLFSYELTEQRTLYIDNMRLTGEEGGISGGSGT